MDQAVTAAAAATPVLAVGTDLSVHDGAWSFAGAVADGFVDHVRASVPLYDVGHSLAAELASAFVRPGGLGYELGCATGQLLRVLATSGPRTQSANWVGVEHQAAMVAAARRHCEGLGNVSVAEADIAGADYRPCDFAVAFLTLNFLDLPARSEALAKVRWALRDGGALFVFEKVLTADPYVAGVVDLLHLRFKRARGLTPEEILNKADSLAGVFQPMTTEENVELLRAVGFRRVAPVMRYLCFEGILAL